MGGVSKAVKQITHEVIPKERLSKDLCAYELGIVEDWDLLRT